MKVTKLSISIATVLACGTANAAGFSDITVHGDMSAGMYFVQNNGGMGAEAMEVTDFGLAFSTPELKAGEVGMKGVLGSRNGRTIMDTSPDGSFAWGDNISLDFGYVSYMPVNALTVDIGWILTTIGNEASPSVFSANVNRGFMWNAQPAAYEGVRASYAIGGTTLSAEANHNNGGVGNPLDFALAVSGSAGPVSYAATYYDGKDTKNIIDVVVNTKVAGMGIGLNLDYYMLDEKPVGAKDDSATGVGVYITPAMGKMEIPVRIEYVTDGDTGIYTVPGGSVATEGATSFTITPTLRISDSMFVRAEVSYVAADKKVFLDKDGAAVDTQTAAAFQIGYTF